MANAPSQFTDSSLSRTLRAFKSVKDTWWAWLTDAVVGLAAASAEWAQAPETATSWERFGRGLLGFAVGTAASAIVIFVLAWGWIIPRRQRDEARALLSPQVEPDVREAIDAIKSATLYLNTPTPEGVYTKPLPIFGVMFEQRDRIATSGLTIQLVQKWMREFGCDPQNYSTDFDGLVGRLTRARVLRERANTPRAFEWDDLGKRALLQIEGAQAELPQS